MGFWVQGSLERCCIEGLCLARILSVDRLCARVPGVLVLVFVLCLKGGLW